jgi:hypothetical protein
MNSRTWPRLWLVMVITLAAANVLLPLAVRAQGAGQVVINYLEAIDTPDKFGVTLRTYFTLTDATGKVNTAPQIDKVKYVLDSEDGGTYDAKVSKASDPISVILVLDFSGNMYNYIGNIQKGAISLVNSLPQDSTFAIIRFSDKVETVQELTKDKNKVVNAIGALKYPAGMTCLFDAVYQGVQLMANAPAGRRAVVVFTGNRDLTYYSKPCSTKTVADVVGLATSRTSRTPIYTIGMRGYQPIAEAELQNMSDASGGITSLGKDALSLFNDATNALNGQFVAEALVSPKQGERNFALRVSVSGGTNPNDVPGRFISPADYSVKPTATPTITPTPLPVSVTINSIQQDLQTKEFVVDLSVVSESLIAEYRFDLLNPSGTLQSQVTKPAPLNGPVRIPIGTLESGQYAIRAFAIGKDRQILARSEPYSVKWEPTPTITPTVTPTPPPIGAVVDTIRYADEVTKDKLIVKLLLSRPEEIARLRATLTNADTGVAVKEFDPLPVAPELTLSLDNVPAAGYNVNVYAFSSGGQQLSISTQKFTYDYATPTPTETATAIPADLIYSISTAISDPNRRGVVLGVFGVIVVAIVLLMAMLFLRKPKKAATGTGFLREMTGAVDVHELAGYAKQQQAKPAAPPRAPGVARTTPPASASPTAPTTFGPDYDKTDAVPYMKLPRSSVTVDRSRDAVNIGKSFPITHVPFTLGRRERDLNFEGDGGVSREHAQITFENNVFFITDNGSTNHTFIDEVETQAGVPAPLYNGATIRLGTSTFLKFQTEQMGDFDSDKTSPEPFKLK